MEATVHFMTSPWKSQTLTVLSWSHRQSWFGVRGTKLRGQEVRCPGSHLGGWPLEAFAPSDASCLGQNHSVTLVSDRILSGVPSQASHGLSFGFDHFYFVFLISDIIPLHGKPLLFEFYSQTRRSKAWRRPVTS